MMPARARFPLPPDLTREEMETLSARGLALPPEGSLCQSPGQKGGLLSRALAGIDIGPKPPPKNGEAGDDASVADVEQSLRKMTIASTTPEAMIAAMKAEDALAKKLKRRKCLIVSCLACLGIFVLICIILIPVMIKVVIPYMVVDGFNNGSGSSSPLIVTEVSFAKMNESGSNGNFTAYMDNVKVPLGIPVTIRGPSKVTLRALIRPPNATDDVPKDWKDMLVIDEYGSDITTVNGRFSTSAKDFFIKVADGGWPLAAFVKGLSRLFVETDPGIVPLLSLAIDGLVNVGTLQYWGLNLDRKLDIGSLLKATDSNVPKLLAIDLSKSNGPLPGIRTVQPSWEVDHFKTGLQIDLDPSQPTPLGFHLRNITFNLTLDGRPLARCFVPELLFRAGTTSFEIPFEFTSLAPPAGSLTSATTVNATNTTTTSTSTSLPTTTTSIGTASSTTQTTTSSASSGGIPSSVVDNLPLVLLGLQNQAARTIGATNVTLFDGDGKQVPWLSLVASQINFEFPLSALQGATQSVVATWILGIVLRALSVQAGQPGALLGNPGSPSTSSPSSLSDLFSGLTGLVSRSSTTSSAASSPTATAVQSLIVMVEVKQKTCLICIDGWGIGLPEEEKGDAIKHAKTPVMTSLAQKYPYLEIAAHGLSVGLPDGLMGNSEVGHLNIGAGRIVYQDIVRIELALKNKTLVNQPALAAALKRASDPSGTGRLHLLGLVSDGGVHSHQDHLHAFLELAKAANIKDTFVHFFGDGRDTSPRSSLGYLDRLRDHMMKINYGTLATVVGRYYAMDRDKRWERVKVAYDAVVDGISNQNVYVSNLEGFRAAIETAYARDETDEFLKPIVLEDSKGAIKDGDTLIFFNFRSDRMRELSSSIGIPPANFAVNRVPKNLSITTMTQYKADFPFALIFPPQKMDNVLGEWLGKHQIPQCHIAETEKYAHVTFFFNGGTEAQYQLEDRDLISSPKVATYDLKPEMSAIEVAEKVAERIRADKHPFVMCNFAPPDMVGHTGVFEAARLGVEATDKAIGIIYEACKEKGYVLFVTADHGNAEKMLAADGTPHTAHTCNKVPFVMTSTTHQFENTTEGILADVAPTILEVMGLPIPEEMSGKSRINK
ncbi:hypothetical protein HDU96_001046 [Phlyctochytrium bullatum]|nr:hypothetical protein HDU96_001046 [Phlyctochytrium bullatum]